MPARGLQRLEVMTKPFFGRLLIFKTTSKIFTRAIKVTNILHVKSANFHTSPYIAMNFNLLSIRWSELSKPEAEKPESRTARLRAAFWRWPQLKSFCSKFFYVFVSAESYPPRHNIFVASNQKRQ